MVLFIRLKLDKPINYDFFLNELPFHDFDRIFDREIIQNARYIFL